MKQAVVLMAVLMAVLLVASGLVLIGSGSQGEQLAQKAAQLTELKRRLAASQAEGQALMEERNMLAEALAAARKEGRTLTGERDAQAEAVAQAEQRQVALEKETAQALAQAGLELEAMESRCLALELAQAARADDAARLTAEADAARQEAEALREQLTQVELGVSGAADERDAARQEAEALREQLARAEQAASEALAERDAALRREQAAQRRAESARLALRQTEREWQAVP